MYQHTNDYESLRESERERDRERKTNSQSFYSKLFWKVQKIFMSSYEHDFVYKKIYT